MTTRLGFSCRHQSFEHILNQLATMLLADAVEGLLASVGLAIGFSSSYLLTTI
jgi:hypothetical protein